MAGIKTFSDATDTSGTANGAVIVSGGVGIAKSLQVGGTITGDGSGLTTLNASNLSSGTVPSARVSGSYTAITGTGALNAGSITSGFGDINIGTSTFTGNGSGLTNVNAATLDSIDSLSFVRSDANDDVTGLLNISRTGEMLKISDTSATGSPYVGFYQAATRRGYIQMVNGGTMRIASDQTGERLDIGSGLTGLTFYENVTNLSHTVWHSGNDGAGSGLDADTLDGANSATANTASTIVARDASGNFAAGTITAALSGNATTATTLATTRAINGTNFNGSAAITTATWGTARTIWGQSINGSANITAAVLPAAGSVSAPAFSTSGNTNTGIYFSAANVMNVATGGTLAATFSATGDFTAVGEVTAYSDVTLKDNIKVIADPLTRILSIRGVTFTRNDQSDTDKVHMGVIAQEVEQYFPEVVHTTENGIKTVNYGAMAGAFIEAFKAQQSQIDELRAMVQTLLDK